MSTSDADLPAVLKIRSRQNRRLKQVRAARDGRVEQVLFLEGRKLAEEALSLGLPRVLVVVSEPFLNQRGAAELVSALAPAEALCVPPWLMAELSDFQTPPGLIVLIPRPDRPSSGRSPTGSLVPILHGIQDPGNLGSILRSAEAAGAEGALVTRTSADPLSPKALRGSMGAALRIPWWRCADGLEAIALAQQAGLTVYASSPRATRDLWQVDWTRPCALLLGSEGSGLSPAEIAAADAEIRIPMAGGESLNVSAAAAVLLFEVTRQRAAARASRPGLPSP